jgi:hypothetical protein
MYRLNGEKMNPLVVEALNRVMPILSDQGVYIVVYPVMVALVCGYILMMYRKGCQRWYM